MNDAFRRTFAGGLVMTTQGVRDLPNDRQRQLLQALRSFNEFSEDNDPYGEHDFGAVTVGDDRFFWKIDYYDTDLAGHSPDATDPAVTRRVMTLMRADEY
ncbi:DUF3768 domain-containing protein [Citreimonas salinaria]|nr:DUF3768 domain-containing protein [Citreimonas salinaria]